jgi:GH15 family glucan-1,4-alpha-glucosidase
MDLIKKSIEVLKSLQFKNGGILSTPKDGAYPYIYPRDAVMTTKAFNRCGLYKNSEKFYYFINKFSKLEQYKEIFHRYNQEGLPCVTRKHEHDNTGLIIHGIYDTYLHNEDETFLDNMWPLIDKCTQAILSFSKTGLINTERSIHEFFRLENGYEIWANSSCCRALYDASKIAKILNHEKESKKWESKAKQIERNMKNKLFNKKLGVFIKNTKFPNAPDISQLSPFYFNLIDSKKILKNTMKYLRKHIWHKELGGFRRFRKFEICKDWHWYTGGSGSWCFSTAWGARFYRELGMKKEYKECLNWINKVALRTGGLLPEHIATKDEYDMWKRGETEFSNRVMDGMKRAERLSSKFKEKIIYWATPLGWSHAEYILLKKEK